MEENRKNLIKKMRSVAIKCIVLFFLTSFFLFGFYMSQPENSTAYADTISGNWSDYASDKFSGGDGSSDDPYKISSAEELAYLANQINSGNTTLNNGLHYKLVKPIDLSAHYWMPIGTLSHQFNGSLDCNNQPILGLTVSGQEKNGLFGNVSSLTISNVIIMNAEINDSAGNAGIIAGEVNGTGITITDAQVSGTITHTGTYPSINDAVGGLIGSVKGGSVNIENTHANTTINISNRTSTNCVAGFVGYSAVSPTVTNSYSVHTIKSQSATVTKKIKTSTMDDSLWFSYSGLNGGLPLLRSQYWISKTNKVSSPSWTGFSTGLSDLACQAELYNVTTKSNKSEGSVTVSSRSTKESGTSIKAVKDEKICLSHTDITGYSFVYSGASISGSQFTMTASNVTITGTYTANTYNVTFNANGGSVDLQSKEVAYDSTYGELPTPTRTGYTFNGWWTAASGGSQVSSTTKVSITSAQTLYAHWTTNTYTVTFNANGGGTPSPITKTVTYDSTYGDLATITRTGYTFNGWYTAASSGTKIETTTKVTITAAQTLYAHWTMNTYTVVIDANGGTCTTTSPLTSNYESEVKVANPTRDGYTFLGWDITGMDDCEHVYVDTEEEIFTKAESLSGIKSTQFYYLRSTSGTVTFTANWAPITYSITYVLNGGTVSTANPTIYTVETATFTLNNPTRTGHTFLGWTGSNGTTAQTSVSIAQGSTGNKSYTARWERNIYTISYDFAGGTAGSSAPTSAIYNGEFTISNPTRTGYTFLGWTITGMDSCTHTCGSSTSTATSLSGVTATTFKNLRSTSGTVTFTAQWTENKYTVVIDANGGTCTTTSPRTLYYSSLLEVVNPTRDGYTFLGWDITGMDDCEHGYQDDGGSGVYTNAESLSGITATHFIRLRSTSGTVTFTAQWYENASYLMRNWNTLFLNEMGSTALIMNKYIKTITFTSTEPSSYSKKFSIGATNEGSSSDGDSQSPHGGDYDKCDDVTAYVVYTVLSGTTYYDIIFFSPNKIYAPKYSKDLFGSQITNYCLTGLTSITFENFDTSKVENMNSMFMGSSALTSLNLNNFDTSNVTKMSNMFYGCSGLTSLTFGSNFKTNNVTEMANMFNNCSNLTELDISNFSNTSNVVYMNCMFYKCSKLETLTLGSSLLTASNVTNFACMFEGCSSLTSLDATSFTTSSATNMSYMFRSCSALTEIKGLTTDTLSKRFTTASVTTMTYMFEGCSSLTSLDLSNFNTSNVTDMHSMFYNCSSLTSLTLGSNFKTTNVTNMNAMFYNCQKLTTLDVSSFSTSNVTDMSSMFCGCAALNIIKGLESTYYTVNKNFLTAKVTSMKQMFHGCKSLTSLDLSNFNRDVDLTSAYYTNTESVKDMSYMFYSCSKLAGINFGDRFDTSSVTTMAHMFNGCSNLTRLDLSSFNTANVTLMQYMFNGCSKLSIINGFTDESNSNFNTEKVTNMAYMFNGCSNILNLYLSSFKINSGVNVEGMLSGMTNVTLISAPYYNAVAITLPRVMEDNKGNTAKTIDAYTGNTIIRTYEV